jgi:hypothetical protein
MQAQEEREAQRKRKEDLMREAEMKRVKVYREKSLINQSREQSVKKREIEIVVS